MTNKNYFDNAIAGIPTVDVFQEGGVLRDYFSKVADAGVKTLKKGYNQYQKLNADVRDALSIPGNAANYAAQTVARTAAKHIKGLSEEDLMKPRWESHSETVNYLNPQKSFNMFENLAMDMAGDPTTVIGGKAVGRKIANAKIIPQSKRILPKDFAIQHRVQPTKARDILHTELVDKRDPSKVYGNINTAKSPTGFTDKSDLVEEYIPQMIQVKESLRGNQVQDLLYQSHLDNLRATGKTDYIRTGDVLRNPEATQKFHDRSIVKEARPSAYNSEDGLAHDVVPKEYYGSRNPNVINDVMNRINTLPKKQKLDPISINDFIGWVLKKPEVAPAPAARGNVMRSAPVTAETPVRPRITLDELNPIKPTVSADGIIRHQL